MIKKVKTTQEFNDVISKGKTLVDFFATWCGPCKMLAPVLEEADEKGMLGDVTIIEVDVDELNDVAASYRIQAVPTLMLFENGKLIKTTMGYHPLSDLISFVK